MFYWCKQSDLTCFWRHQPDEVFPMLHFTTMGPLHWLAKTYQHSPAVSVAFMLSPVLHITQKVNFCSTVSCFEEHFNCFFAHIKKIGLLMRITKILHRWKIWRPHLHLVFSLTLIACWEVFADYEENFYLTLLTHFQASEASFWLWSHAYSRI